ncbi:ABC transporter substrate-binding protein [Micrococcus sp. IITD107]|uniref:ABC transporter substrate-binding protein n=1 Tax=Micrococcus sp. IITD107 TaxID=3342790 RepID=UPI0035BA497B
MSKIITRSPGSRQRGAFTVGLVAIALTLSACGNGAQAQNPTTGPESAAASGEPVEGGHLVFADVVPAPRWQTQSATDYRQANVLNSVLDRLTYYDAETETLVPWIATDWSPNDDLTEWTFTIREGVTFSDGTPLDAEAVARNLQVFGEGITDAQIQPNQDYKNFVSAEVTGDDQVTVTLSEPNANFVRATSSVTSGLVAPSVFELDNAGQNDIAQVIGSGPFTFESQVPDQEIVFTAREDYAWAPETAENQGAPYLDGFTLRYLPEVGHRAGSVSTGQADLVRGIQPVDEATLEAAGHSVYAAPGTDLSSNHMAVRFENEEVSDARVRQALQIGTNREAIKQTVLSDSYQLSGSILNHGAPGFVDLSEDFAYDPERAKELLDEAGWTVGSDGIREKDGQRLELTVSASSNSVVIKPVFDLMVQQWAELGVKLTSRAGDNTFFLQAQTDETVPLYGTRAFSYGGLGPLYGSGGTLTLADDPEFDELVDRANAEADEDARNEILAEQQDYIVNEQAHAIVLWDEVQVYGAHSGTHVEFTTGAAPIFQGAWKEGE